MNSQTKIDLYQLHKKEYAAPKKPVLVEVGQAFYLTIEGQGPPGGEVFTDRIGAFYAVAYTVKMTRKFAGEQDYVIGKLEGQWWGPDETEDLDQAPPEQWCWKLMIRTPDFVSRAELERAASVLIEKGKTLSTRDVRLEPLEEGLCVQMLHVGPYDREPETFAVMAEFAEKAGKKFHGRHHDIYLSDPRRVAPERLKTILRRPIL